MNSPNNNPEEKKEPTTHPASLVPLRSVLEFIGAEPNQDKDRNKWKVEGKGNIAVKGQKWFDLNNQKGGWGASSFVAYVLDLTKKQAINYLMEHFSDEIDMERMVPMTMDEKEEKKPFNPPAPVHENIKYVKDYLVNTRQLPEEMISHLIADGKIYADDRKRCIFLAHNSAEIRGTTEFDQFKGCAEGSDTENSGFTVFNKDRKTNVIAINEAAIDALSYLAFHPSVFAISTNGSGRFDLQMNIVEEAYNNKYKVILATDADWPGDAAAQKIFNAIYLKHYISRQLKVPIEVVHDWLLEKEKYKKIDLELEDSEEQLFFAKKSFDPKTATIRFKPSKGLHPIFKEGKTYKIQVTEAGHNFITDFLRRDRPVLTKDWNEEWKAKPKMKNHP